MDKICVISIVLLICACVNGSCLPENVKDDLIQCLMDNQMLTFYQFPRVLSTKYDNLCINTTCMTYCMEQIISLCWPADHMTHLGRGDALTAAYLGLCDQPEAEVRNALSCGSLVSNQDALNLISLFQLTLENSYTTLSINTTAVCIDWMTMKTGLDTLIAAQCSGTSLTHWQTFLNTISYKCDDTLTPSWYADYKLTSIHRCSGTNKLRTNVYMIFNVFLLVLFKMCRQNFV
ncbi:hypothetical protein ACF0H5_024559 [Mactra antiquata]